MSVTHDEAAEAAFGDEEDEYGALQAAALQRPLALEDGPTRRRPAKRVAVAHGFSLHADTAEPGNDRQRLWTVCELRMNPGPSSMTC